MSGLVLDKPKDLQQISPKHPFHHINTILNEKRNSTCSKEPESECGLATAEPNIAHSSIASSSPANVGIEVNIRDIKSGLLQ